MPKTTYGTVNEIGKAIEHLTDARRFFQGTAGYPKNPEEGDECLIRAGEAMTKLLKGVNKRSKQ